MRDLHRTYLDRRQKFFIGMSKESLVSFLALPSEKEAAAFHISTCDRDVEEMIIFEAKMLVTKDGGVKLFMEMDGQEET